MSLNQNSVVGASFRDPSGFVFKKDNIIYRQINERYREHYDFFLSSGLYEKLLQQQLIIPHEEVSFKEPIPESCYKIIKPKQLPFVSYPYEWCFSQFKEAALATLQIQKTALEHGMILKDASAYNIQFDHYQPCLIDTLSFERYEEGQVWMGYRQFCQHFLAPLALMSQVDIQLNQLMDSFIDGVPLDLASKLLPLHSRFNFHLLCHIHLHGKAQVRYSDKAVDVKQAKMSKLSLMGLIDSLESAVKGLQWKAGQTEWGDYYNNTNYSDESFEKKKEIITQVLSDLQPNIVWDLGANTGIFSRIASSKGIDVVSFDKDPLAVEVNFLVSVKEKEKHILPLILDLTNPSAASGWHHHERKSLLERGSADVVFALALIHHLVISNNVPMNKLAAFFSDIAPHLIIEFVPKEDSQVKKLLTTREDIFDDYHEDGFKHHFGLLYDVVQEIDVVGSTRTIFVLRKK